MAALEQQTSDILSSSGELKHAALVREIRRQIHSGELCPGDQLPSFVELRRRWGVGHETLEKMYLELEREGLVTRKHRRGIFVSRSQADSPAPVQPQKKQGTIGFVSIPSLFKHPYYVHLLEGVRHEAQKSGVEVLLLGDPASIPWEKIDGVIYQATQHISIEPVTYMPRVALVIAQPSLDSVVADDYLGISQAMDYLFSLGHQRIAMLSIEGQPHSMSRQRAAAYLEAFNARNMPFQRNWMRTLTDPGPGGADWEDVGYEDMRRWLEEDWAELGCTALLAHNDETAIGVVTALQEKGRRVPEDVSIIGFDGTEIAHFHRPRLSTVQAPLFEIGARGFEMLLAQINRPLHEEEKERLPLRLSLPTKFIAEQSTGPAPHR